jgi:hypothetical protein
MKAVYFKISVFGKDSPLTVRIVEDSRSKSTDPLTL